MYALSYELKFITRLDPYVISLFHMFVMYVVIRARLGVHQLTFNRDPDSIFRGMNNHRIGLRYFMTYDCTLWGLR